MKIMVLAQLPISYKWKYMNPSVESFLGIIYKNS